MIAQHIPTAFAQLGCTLYISEFACSHIFRKYIMAAFVYFVEKCMIIWYNSHN